MSPLVVFPLLKGCVELVCSPLMHSFRSGFRREGSLKPSLMLYAEQGCSCGGCLSRVGGEGLR